MLLAAPLAAPSRSVADGDPASDYLPQAPVFYPFQPTVAPALRRELEQTLAQLRARGLNLKVAVILSPEDLGAVHVLYGRPQLYAQLLDYEISFRGPQPLLVVEPAGFGISHVGSRSVLRGVPVDRTHQSDGLVHSAILAVVALAKARRIIVVPSGDAGNGGSLPAAGVPVLLVLIVVIGGLVAGRRRWRARE